MTLSLIFFITLQIFFSALKFCFTRIVYFTRREAPDTFVSVQTLCVSKKKKIRLSSWKYGPVFMKTSVVHHENLDCLSWKSCSFLLKISTVHYENLILLSWKSRPATMKMWICHHKNLGLPSENLDLSKYTKSQLFAEMKFHRNSNI